ncbi:MAG TPA: GNAT family protein [Lachnospiraceae bacterium]|nr:GNAT family protein [Lachnospiraceae bacterium]
MECKIRSWLVEDAEDLAKALNNKSIHNNLRDGLPFPYTVKDATAFIQEMHSADPEKAYAFAITYQERVIGSIGIFRKENIHSRTAEIGYYISEEFWGKGLGTSALKQACKYVFDNTDMIRIFADPFARNIASCRILEKSGFLYEGTLYANAFKNGKVEDMIMYALIKS